MSVEKRVAKFDVRLTRSELAHLRDLMSVALPSPDGATVSFMLAQTEGRDGIDESLWDKITSACKDAKLPLEDDAPDYVVAPTSSPSMGVFRLQEDEDLIVSDGEQTEKKDEPAVSNGASALHSSEQTDEGDTMSSGRRNDEKDVEGKQRRLQSNGRKKRRRP